MIEESGRTQRGHRGWWLCFGVITLAASLNAAGTASTRGGADPSRS
jgi:hypothetical protein